MSLLTDKFEIINNWVSGASFAKVTFSQFWDIGNIVGGYTRFFWAPVLLALGIWVYLHDPYGEFSKKMGMRELVKMGRKEWPFATMFYDENMNQEKRYKTRFRPMKPREFTTAYKLLNEDGALDDARAEMIFTKQLGNEFSGIRNWQLHKRAILALCLLKYERKNKEYISLRNHIAEVFIQSKKIVGAKPAIDSALKGVGQKGKKLLMRLTKAHAYEATWFYSLYKASRKGVFAPVEFSWLKVIDRPLWLNLDCMERRRAWAEVSGIRAHWLAEKSYGSAIKTPVLTEAVIGLREAISEVKERETSDDDE